MEIPETWPETPPPTMAVGRWKHMRKALPSPLEYVAEYGKMTPRAFQDKYDMTSNDYSKVRAMLGLDHKRHRRPIPVPAPGPVQPQLQAPLDPDELALKVAVQTVSLLREELRTIIREELAPQAEADAIWAHLAPRLRDYDKPIGGNGIRP